MIPPLLLDVRSHHAVLDLCAAPGSKTAQIVELMHADAGNSKLPTGVVIANDREQKRCYLLIHQLQRLQSPAAIVTRHDATNYPKMFISTDQGEQQLLFDRVLTDVPCSGDGTLRKNADLWPRWSPSLALAEHFVQGKILRRGLELLTVGGKLVYSTCSLNPLEDEAVVASVLSVCDGAVHIEDQTDKLPELKWTPGISHWRVMLKDGQWCDTLEDVPEKHRRCIRPSLFPPSNAASLGLEKCMRILPHQQDTGGFFVAVLVKTSHLPWMRDSKESKVPVGSKVDGNNQEIVQERDSPLAKRMCVASPTTDNVEVKEPNDVPSPATSNETNPVNFTNSKPGGKRGQGKKSARIYQEDPFHFLPSNALEVDSDWRSTVEFYQISPDFPVQQVMFRRAVRDEKAKRRRNFYFTNSLARNVLLSNENRGINFVNLGVKILGISDDTHFQGYRLLQEGIYLMEPHIGAVRRVRIGSRDDLITILTYDMPLVDLLKHPETVKSYETTPVGPVLMEYNPENPIYSPGVKLHLTGWRGLASLRHYLDKHERDHLFRVCGYDEVPRIQSAPRRPPTESNKTEENS
jgi:tRNA (cytosine34-C5)-methyltransferase